MEGSRGEKSDHVVIIVVIVVVVVLLAAMILSAFFFLSVSNSFGSFNSYSTDTNVTPVAGQTSLELVAGNCNIDVEPGSGNLIYVNLSVTARTSLNSQNVYISVDTQSTGIQITFHTPISFTYLVNGIVYIPTSMSLNNLNLSTMNGNENVNYPFNVSHLKMNTLNGNIGITSEIGSSGMTGGSILASTTNGNVNINGTGFSGISATTSNGNVHITIQGAITTGNFTMEAINGNLNLFLENTSKASLYLSTTNGGITTAGLNIQTTSSSVHSFTGTLNGGGATVTMTTTNGNIYLYGGTA